MTKLKSVLLVLLMMSAAVPSARADDRRRTSEDFEGLPLWSQEQATKVQKYLQEAGFPVGVAEIESYGRHFTVDLERRCGLAKFDLDLALRDSNRKFAFSLKDNDGETHSFDFTRRSEDVLILGMIRDTGVSVLLGAFWESAVVGALVAGVTLTGEVYVKGSAMDFSLLEVPRDRKRAIGEILGVLNRLVRASYDNDVNAAREAATEIRHQCIDSKFESTAVYGNRGRTSARESAPARESHPPEPGETGVRAFPAE